MAIEQRSSTSGSLYYDETPRAFIPPPIAEIKALSKQREEDYIKTKNEQNALDKFKRNLPSTYSPEIYNSILGKIDESLQGITPDNYADKVLDVEQLSNDVVNKYGGAELVEQQKQVQAAASQVDEAVAKGQLSDPNKALWKKSQIQTKPLVVDANGFISKPTVQSPAIVPDQNISEELEKLMKGWAENGTYTKDPRTGQITTKGGLPGYITYGKETSISEAELRKAGMQFLENDPKIKAYLEDQAAYESKDIPLNGEGLSKVLSQTDRDALTGITNSSVGDLEQLVNTAPNLDVQGIITEVTKHKIKQNQVEPYAQKFGFLKEEIVPLEDKILKGYLDTQRDIAKAKADAAKTVVADTAVITLEPFMTNRIVNPTDLGVIQSNKKVLQTNLIQKQTELNTYTRQVKEGVRGADPRRVEELNKELTDLDNQLATIDEQEKGLQRLVTSNFKNAGVDLDKRFKEVYPEIVKLTKDKNINILTKAVADFQLKTPTPGGTVNSFGSLDLANMSKIKDSALAPRDKEIIKANTKVVNGKTVLDLNTNTAYLLTPLKSIVLTDAGTLSSDVNISTEFKNDVNSKLYKAPTNSGFKNDILEAYNTGEDSTNIIGMNKDSIEIKNHLLPNSILKDVERLRAKKGTYNWELSVPLSYLAVTGESNKSSTKNYVNYETAERKSFTENKSQYSINKGGKLIKLGDYLKTEYGIPDLSSTYIDDDKSTFHTLVESDRNYGQLYGTSLKLTPKGLEVARANNPEAFAAESDIKVSLVNPNKRYNAQIRDQLVRSAPHLMSQSSEQSRDMLNQMGVVYANNSPEGQELTNLNLYTMAPGDKKVFTVRGKDYNVSTWVKDADEPNDMNQDFTVSRNNGGVEEVQAMDSKGNTAWKPLKSIQDGKDAEWSKIKYETPTDIMSMIGTTMLIDDVKKGIGTEDGVSTYNPYAEIMNSATYKKAAGGGVVSTKAEKVTETIIKNEGSPLQNIQLYNYNTKKAEVIQSRIGTDNLLNLKDIYPTQVKQDVSFPYINSKVAPKLDLIMKNYGLTITGGFRGDSTHDALKSGAKNSIHKYALSLDFGYDDKGKDFLSALEASPELAQNMGILRAEKHDNPAHVHLEFNPGLLE